MDAVKSAAAAVGRFMKNLWAKGWWGKLGAIVIVLFACGVVQKGLMSVGLMDPLPTAVPIPTATTRPTTDPVIAAGTETASAEMRGTEQANADATKAAMPTEAPSFKDGTLLVGTDIQPGIYRTANESGSCYYSRLKGVSGELEDIIANDNPSGPTIIEILDGDEAFKSERCGKWTLDAGTGGANATTFGDGTYMVGRDIQPGRYRNEGHELCYYARLANFRGELDAIISNENTDGQAIVDIAASDAGFSSTRCGTWTKVE